MRISIFFAVFIFVLYSSCSESASYLYQVPENIDDGIETASLLSVGMDTMLISKGVKRIRTGRYKEIHSLLIYKDGKLVLEEYFSGHRYRWDAKNFDAEMVSWNREMLHMIASDTKSITGLCIGIALEQGFIKSLDQSIFDYMPDYEKFNRNGRENITIKDLVTMTSGLEWDEWSISLGSRKNDIINAYFQDDPLAYILAKPMVLKPRTRFTYSGGNTNLLAEIILNASQMPIDSFANQYLFKPLGVDTVTWDRYPNGKVDAAGSIKLRPRDMMKVGIMMLNNGTWQGNRIISEEWVKKCANTYPVNEDLNAPGTDGGPVGYSYTWWTRTVEIEGKRVDSFHAAGWGGQYIKVFPDLNAVVVFTGGNHDTKTTNFRVLDRFILPSMIK